MELEEDLPYQYFGRESNFEDASVFGEERWRLQVALSL